MLLNANSGVFVNEMQWHGGVHCVIHRNAQEIDVHNLSFVRMVLDITHDHGVASFADGNCQNV